MVILFYLLIDFHEMLYDVTRFENNNFRKYSAIRGVDFSIHIPLWVTEVLSNSIQGITALEWAGERLGRSSKGCPDHQRMEREEYCRDGRLPCQLRPGRPSSGFPSTLCSTSTMDVFLDSFEAPPEMSLFVGFKCIDGG